MAQVIRDCSHIVLDECTMAHKYCIEALECTLRDIRGNDLLMGGITVLFSGDFRQTLPVIVKGTRADEVNACLKISFLWPYIERLFLTKNMRVASGTEREIEDFSNVSISIGEGTLDNTNGLITTPPSLGNVVTSRDQLIQKVFTEIQNLLNFNGSWLCERAILTPTNEQAAEINRKVLSFF